MVSPSGLLASPGRYVERVACWRGIRYALFMAHTRVIGTVHRSTNVTVTWGSCTVYGLLALYYPAPYNNI